MKGLNNMNNEFTLRKFETRDIFMMAAVIEKIGLMQIINVIKMNSFRENAKHEGNKEKYKAVGRAVGLEIAATIVGKLSDCEAEIYKLLSSLSGKTSDEIAKQSPVVTIRMIKTFLNMDGFSDFFTEVLELLTAQKAE
jgi:hypothetical protein